MRKYEDLVFNAERIYIVDVIGRKKETFRIHTEKEIMNKAFPFNELKDGEGVD